VKAAISTPLSLRSFGYCDDYGLDEFRFDEDGLGAGARGDARVINEARQAESLGTITATPFRGSGSVFDPEDEAVPGDNGKAARLNKDSLRTRKHRAGGIFASCFVIPFAR
jgi:hypothetical protein